MLLFGLAVLSLHKVGRVIEVGLQIASVAYGALLGVFLLGVLTRRANQYGAMVGMLFGFVTELYIWLFTRVPWTWYVAIGTVVTFAVGYGVSWVLAGKAFNRKGRKVNRKGRKEELLTLNRQNLGFARAVFFAVFANSLRPLR